MKSKTKTVYYCDHCKKKGLVKSKMESHEELCHKNPANDRPCFSCVHLTKEAVLARQTRPDGSVSEFDAVLFYCRDTKCFLHTPQAIAKKKTFELEEANYPMPNTCDSYKPQITPPF